MSPIKNLPAAARKFSPTPSVFGHAVENYDASPKCFRATFAAGLAALVVAAQPGLAFGLLAEFGAAPWRGLRRQTAHTNKITPKITHQ